MTFSEEDQKVVEAARKIGWEAAGRRCAEIARRANSMRLKMLIEREFGLDGEAPRPALDDSFRRAIERAELQAVPHYPHPSCVVISMRREDWEACQKALGRPVK